MGRSRAELNFNRLQKLAGMSLEELTADHKAFKVKSEGFMDLSIETHPHLSTESYRVVSLTHYYEQNGDLVPDPDMMIRVYLDRKTVEPATFQDSYRFQEVYLEGNRWRPQLAKELSSFLATWLVNLKKQGFYK